MADPIALAPPTWRVSSYDAAVASLVGPGSCARVHSVFRRAANLLVEVPCAGTALVTLVDPVLDDAPRTIRLAASLDLQDFLTADTEAMLGLGLAEARPWQPGTVPLTDLDASSAQRASMRLTVLLRRHGTGGGVLPPPDGATAMDRAVANRVASAIAALGTPPFAFGTRHLEPLLGLGPGLTPTGDDVLTGLALVAAQPGSGLADLAAAAAELVDRYGERTTLVSAVTLAEASRGRARESLIDLVRALVAPSSGSDLTVALRRVLAIGHSSGTDLAAGIALGLDLLAQRRARVRPVRRV